VAGHGKLARPKGLWEFQNLCYGLRSPTTRPERAYYDLTATMESRREILVGLSVSLTGRFSAQGRQALDGLRLWQSYVNGRNGIMIGQAAPRPVRLAIYNDQSRTSVARENALRLLRQDRVDALFGPYSSGLTMTVAEVAREQKKALWNHGGASDEILSRGWQHVVSTPTPASDYLRDLPAWLARQAPPFGKICIVHSTRGTFAPHVAQGVVQAAPPQYSAQLISYSALDVDVLVQTLRASRAEILVLAGSFEQEIQIMRARQRWPASIQAVAAVAAGVHAFHDELDRAAEGIIGPSQWEAHVTFPADIGPDAVWFMRTFRQQFGREPEYTAAGSFAVGLIFEKCVRDASSLQDKDLLAAAAELDCYTFYGRFRLDSASGRQVGHRILLVQWEQDHKILLPAGDTE
jgi:branched-chain amino acid transport system substrate-binding protein